MPFAATVAESEILDVGNEMTKHTAPFITPVTRLRADDYGELLGSGTFIQLRGKPYILTNEHVAVYRKQYHLAHIVADGRPPALIRHSFQCLTSPTDTAIARIDEENMNTGTKRPIPPDRISLRFSPVAGEIMFIHGYPGQNSHFSAIGHGICCRSLPFATHVVELPRDSDLDPQQHFALGYPTSTKHKDVHGKPMDLPNPSGLSGTLVWDTRFVAACKDGWAPTQATVAGLIVGWDPNNQCLTATKIEVVRHFLVLVLSHEAA